MKRILLVVSLLLLGACAVAPTQEMSDARQAVRAAHAVGADKYAPDTLHKAEIQLHNAGDQLRKRAFRMARKDAESAKINAINAQDIAHAIGAATMVVEKADKRGVLSTEASSLLSRARTAASEGGVLAAINLANEARNLADQDLRLK